MTMRIALLYMGGTFGCIGEPLSPLPFNEFLPYLQHAIPQGLVVDCIAAPSIKDSSACTAPDWLMLVQEIQRLQQLGYTHFAIIHGTDTLSYAAATLARFLGNSSPVVMTGSQYPLLDSTGQQQRKSTDALNNLHFALEQLLKLPNGVYLAFHYQVFHAQTALKIQTTALDAFTGVLAAQSCSISDKESYQVQDKDIQRSKHLAILNIMAQPVGLAAFGQQLANVLAHPPHFLIVQGFGSANLAVNDEIIEIFQQLFQQGCLTILGTQVCFGQTEQRYAISEWVHTAHILSNNTHGHADLYAKILKLYLKFDTPAKRFSHWALS